MALLPAVRLETITAEDAELAALRAANARLEKQNEALIQELIEERVYTAQLTDIIEEQGIGDSDE